MTAGENAFMILAEELNFTQAAKKLYISQQGLSDHIRKLEEHYNTILVIRRPRVSLTESGRALLAMLRRQKTMEEDLRRTIAEIDEGSFGSVTIGMNTSRAGFLTDPLIESFSVKYPKVQVRLMTADTLALEKHLLKGSIDGFIGVSARPNPRIKIEPLLEEGIWLVTSEQNLRKMAADAKSTAIAAKETGIAAKSTAIAAKGTVSLKDFAELTFVRNFPGSTLNLLVDRKLEEYGIRLNTAVQVSNYGVQAQLCQNRGYAMFCPATVAFAKGGPAYMEGMAALKVTDLDETLHVSLVTDSQRNYPACAKAFFEEIRTLIPGLRTI